MKDLIQILLIVIAIVSCTHHKSQYESSKELPIWVTSPYEFCDEQRFWCVAGEGSTMSAAEANARASLASIFEVKIKSELSGVNRIQGTSSFQEDYQSVQYSVQNEVDLVLEGVKITERKKVKNLFYTLARLDLQESLKLFLTKIKPIDEELSLLKKAQNRFAYNRLIYLIKAREELGLRAQLVGTLPPEVFTRTDLKKFKDSFTPLDFVWKNKESLPDWLRSQLQEIFSEINLKQTSSSKIIIETNWEEKEEFLKVKGFKRASFNLNFSIRDSKFGLSKTISGRSLKDARQRVQKDLSQELILKLSELETVY